MTDSLKRIVDLSISSFAACVLQRSTSSEFSFRLIQPDIRFHFVAKYLYRLKLNQLDIIQY